MAVDSLGLNMSRTVFLPEESQYGKGCQRTSNYIQLDQYIVIGENTLLSTFRLTG